jgi:hypothetical protein
MAEKSSAYNDNRHGRLSRGRWYQDIPGTSLYQFLGKNEEGYRFSKRESRDRKPEVIKLKESDLSLLIPVCGVKQVGERIRATLCVGPAYVPSP